jgi:hypothetical protein
MSVKVLLSISRTGRAASGAASTKRGGWRQPGAGSVQVLQGQGGGGGEIREGGRENESGSPGLRNVAVER